MMTNFQCYCYGIVAIDNILKSKKKITHENFFCELYSLWEKNSKPEDIYFEYLKRVGLSEFTN